MHIKQWPSIGETIENMQSVFVVSLLLISQVWVGAQSDGDGDGNGDKTPSKLINDSQEDQDVLVDLLLSNRNSNKVSYQADDEKWIESFDPGCKTVFIIPGYQTGKLRVFQELVEAYLQLDECYNVVFCIWWSSFDPDYIVSAQSVYDVGGYIGQRILELYGKAQLTGTIELVGHGLGAHVAGCAGRTTYDVLPVDVIHGLDAAGELFTDAYLAFDDFKLTPTDANRVTCLHTNSNGVGTTKECGKHDFYANSGGKQPGIVFEHRGYYSHMRALAYYIEGLSSEALVARGPLGYPTTRYGRTMAKNTPAGKYYFKTNTKPPYGRN